MSYRGRSACCASARARLRVGSERSQQLPAIQVLAVAVGFDRLVGTLLNSCSTGKRLPDMRISRIETTFRPYIHRSRYGVMGCHPVVRPKSIAKGGSIVAAASRQKTRKLSTRTPRLKELSSCGVVMIRPRFSIMPSIKAIILATDHAWAGNLVAPWTQFRKNLR